MPTAPQTAAQESQHVVLVGGGLHNAVLALAVLDAFPTLQVTLIERDATLGGNHTWCFHAGDVSQASMAWLGALVTAAWPAYEVRFPKHTRTVEGGYFMITSERLHEVVQARFAENAARASLRLGSCVTRIDSHSATLADGSVIAGDFVLDARGPERMAHAQAGAWSIVGYQKFVGLELELEEPCSRRVPLLMDARLPQTDGFRFMYVLPLSGNRVLIEDTYYADGPELDERAITEDILDYAQQCGIRAAQVVRTERGVLPLPGRMPKPQPADGPVLLGYAAGLFHPTTGYSLSLAVRVAEHVRQHGLPHAFGKPWQGLRQRLRRQQGFTCLLNRLLFGAIAADERYRVLERFYTLPDATIERFYALQLDALDRARIICGRPPAGMSMRSAALKGAFA
jgi:lycopene beta-cyclase